MGELVEHDAIEERFVTPVGHLNREPVPAADGGVERRAERRRDAEDDPGARPPVVVIREEVRRERRHDVLDGGVFVDEPGHAEPRCNPLSLYTLWAVQIDNHTIPLVRCSKSVPVTLGIARNY